MAYERVKFSWCDRECRREGTVEPLAWDARVPKDCAGETSCRECWSRPCECGEPRSRRMPRFFAVTVFERAIDQRLEKMEAGDDVLGCGLAQGGKAFDQPEDGDVLSIAIASEVPAGFLPVLLRAREAG